MVYMNLALWIGSDQNLPVKIRITVLLERYVFYLLS